MITTATLKRMVELLAVPVRDLEAWFSEEDDIVVDAPTESDIDAVIGTDGAVVVTAGPRLSGREGVEASRARAAQYLVLGVARRGSTLAQVLTACVARGVEEPAALIDLMCALPLSARTIRWALAGKRVETPDGVVDPSGWVTAQTSLLATVERIDRIATSGAPEDRILIRDARAERFVLVVSEPTGWVVGQRVAVREDELTNITGDPELDSASPFPPRGTFLFQRVPPSPEEAVATLLQSVAAAIGEPGDGRHHDLDLLALEPRPDGGWDARFRLVDDADAFSQYDRTTTWEGEARLAASDSGPRLVDGRMTVVAAGEASRHPLGQVVPLQPAPRSLT